MVFVEGASTTLKNSLLLYIKVLSMEENPAPPRIMIIPLFVLILGDAGFLPSTVVKVGSGHESHGVMNCYPVTMHVWCMEYGIFAYMKNLDALGLDLMTWLHSQTCGILTRLPLYESKPLGWSASQ